DPNRRTTLKSGLLSIAPDDKPEPVTGGGPSSWHSFPFGMWGFAASRIDNANRVPARQQDPGLRGRRWAPSRRASPSVDPRATGRATATRVPLATRPIAERDQ